MNRFTYIAIISLSISFLFSNAAGVKGKDKPFSFQNKSKGVINPNQSKDLKFELMQLEKEFKSEYEMIKSVYKEKIIPIKEMQKTEVKSLKGNYNNRRKAIYKKYGVKPPKKNENSSFDGSDIYKPNKGDAKQSHSPNKRSIK